MRTAAGDRPAVPILASASWPVLENCLPATELTETSISAVAADAGVDAALVHHYFGTKRQLFAAAIHLPIDPMEILGPCGKPRSRNSV